MRYAEKTHNLSAPDASALVSVVSERAASDRDCTRYSRCRAVLELATQLVEGSHTQVIADIFQSGCKIFAALEHLQD